MSRKVAALTLTFCIIVLAYSSTSYGQTVEIVKHQKQYSTAHIELARLDGKPGVAAVFEGSDDLHYYAKKETAPAGYKLTVQAKSDNVEFAEAVFPKYQVFTEPALNKNVEVYAGDFAVFVPIKTPEAQTDAAGKKADVEVKISGIACTSMICLAPFEKVLRTSVDFSQADSWKQITLETDAHAEKAVTGPAYSVYFALPLALLAGLSLNIMPCVWPVLPIIVMRIVEQSRHSRARSVTMGLALCLGILLFFACLAAVNIVLQVFYGTVLQWGDQFRSPAFVAAMSLLLVVMALFMFGIFNISLPSAITGRTGSGKGYAGSLGMGFLAAILSTPCSFAILATAFAWAQAQHWLLGTLAIMVIGVGMAVPYAILTSMPGLLKNLPRSGRWMELFKQAIGFVLLIIALKLAVALPQVRQTGVLYFSVVLAFCIWMWGSWVDYGTKAAKKYLVRITAAVLAIIAGWAFLRAPAAALIDWQPYDSFVIKSSLEQKKPVLIKFTADWCLNCGVAEKVVYSRKDIAGLIEERGVLAIRADTTEKDFQATKDLKNLYNEPGVPVSMLFIPGEDEPVRWRSIFFADKLKSLLQQLPTSQTPASLTQK